MFRRPYTPPIQATQVRVQCRLDGPWLHDVWLIVDQAGRTSVRFDGEVYPDGAWVNLPLTGGEVEELWRAVQAAPSPCPAATETAARFPARPAVAVPRAIMPRRRPPGPPPALKVQATVRGDALHIVVRGLRLTDLPPACRPPPRLSRAMRLLLLAARRRDEWMTRKALAVLAGFKPNNYSSKAIGSLVELKLMTVDRDGRVRVTAKGKRGAL